MAKRIGEYLVEKKILTEPQVRDILEHSRSKSLRFGAAAIDLGVLSEERLASVFGPHNQVDFFHLDPTLFLEATRDWLPLDTVLKLGVLPLGTKARKGLFSGGGSDLNLGFLSPSPQALDDAKNRILPLLKPRGVQELRPYLVLADSFIQVLERCYGMSGGQLDALGSRSGVHPVLSLHLG